jgi:hypothetical protein
MLRGSMSKIDQEKIIAFQKTIYTVFTGVEKISFTIGTRSDELKNLFCSKNEKTGVFITAFNAYGQIQSDNMNKVSNENLLFDLTKLAEYVYLGQGADPTGNWPPEVSFLALGVDIKTSKELGQKHHQDAIVWIGEGAVPELFLLR